MSFVTLSPLALQHLLLDAATQLVTDMVQCDLGEPGQKAMGERLLLGRCEAEVARPCPGPALSSPRLGSRAK